MVDLRTEPDYAMYLIPTAENITFAGLPELPLQLTWKIVLYSDGGSGAHGTADTGSTCALKTCDSGRASQEEKMGLLKQFAGRCPQFASGLAELLVHRVHQLRRFLAREAVPDRLAFAAGSHEVLAAKHREMLRQGRLTEADEWLELADRLLAFRQLAKDQQAGRIRHRRKYATGAGGVLFHPTHGRAIHERRRAGRRRRVIA